MIEHCIESLNEVWILDVGHKQSGEIWTQVLVKDFSLELIS